MFFLEINKPASAGLFIDYIILAFPVKSYHNIKGLKRYILY